MTPDISELVRDLRHMGNASNQFEICNRAAAALTRLSERTNHTSLDHDHHTLWNVICEAAVLIDHSAMGNENNAEHESACMDFLDRLRSHPDTKRIQKEVIRSNAVVSTVYPTCAKCGCDTKGETALVGDQIWCHPCADAVSKSGEGS